MTLTRRPVTQQMDGELLERIKLTAGTVYVGQPINVQAVVTDECDRSTVTINGSPGAEQLIQFTNPGTKRVSVAVADNQGRVDRRSVPVDVDPRPEDCDGGSLYPVIEVRQNYVLDTGASFGIENHDAVAAYEERLDEDFRYVWVIGEEGRFTTTRPSFEYEFGDSLDATTEYENFDVRLYVKDSAGREALTGARTVGVWNPYVLAKQRGVIQPPVDPDTYAGRDGDQYVGHFEIENREPEPIEFESVQVEYLHDDPTTRGTPSDHERHEWTLEGESTLERSFGLDVDLLPDSAYGFAAHFHGNTSQSDLDVIASAYFEVRSNPQEGIELTDPDLISVLDGIRSRDYFRDRDVIPLDTLRRELDRRPGCVLPADTGRVSEVTGEWITDKLVEAEADADRTPQMVEDGGDVVGEECIPGETPPEDDLVCELTDEERWVTVPGRILNARKGDVVLSPGGNGAIGGLLKQVEPPQVYSHCGIMIENHYRIRHSTASTEWIRNATAGIEGSEGLEPEKVKYAWPGTLDQSVVEAFNGTTLTDPSGETEDDGSPVTYEIDTFDNSTDLSPGIGLVHPRVVRPEPSVEATLPSVRDHLHRVADSSTEIDGHYRFYAYTEANAFFNDFRQAPDRGEDWWASETLPTVCSSFIWAAAERLEDPEIALETTEEFSRTRDLEPEDVDGGAEVDFETRDGLYYYTETERQVAAAWLHDYLVDLVEDKLSADFGPFGGAVDWITDAADDTADQMCNTFAFDWSGRNDAGNHAKDSNRWQTPDDGHAVSPDDIMNFWDAPSRVGDQVEGLYGYSEPLRYRPPRLERRRVSRWKRAADEEATLEGRVTFRGEAVSGAHVSAAGPEMEDVTDDDGGFELTLPAGSYRVNAGKDVDGGYAEGHVNVSLEAGETTSHVIVLEEPDDRFRSLDVRGSMNIVDDEPWPMDPATAATDFFLGDIRVGPYDTHATRSYDERMGGEVRVELELEFDWQLDASVNVGVAARLYEGTSEHTDDLEDTESGTFTVDKDGSLSMSIPLENTEFAGGDTADVTLDITNNRQP